MPAVGMTYRARRRRRKARARQSFPMQRRGGGAFSRQHQARSGTIRSASG